MVAFSNRQKVTLSDGLCIVIHQYASLSSCMQFADQLGMFPSIYSVSHIDSYNIGQIMAPW